MKISVRWEKSSACKTWTHGYVGNRRLFTIEEEPQEPVMLLRHLPGTHGSQSALKCISKADAKREADVELADFLKQVPPLAIE